MELLTAYNHTLTRILDFDEADNLIINQKVHMSIKEVESIAWQETLNDFSKLQTMQNIED